MPQPRGFRGGHAPGHLRNAFLDSLDGRLGSHGEVHADAVSFYDPNLQKRWDAWDGRQRARWLLGQLFSCSDILPGSVADEVASLSDTLYAKDIRTYAQAARFLMELHDFNGVTV
jgi:hypothetical protein